MTVTAGLIPGTKDYGFTENPLVQFFIPSLKQVNNPAQKSPGGLDYSNVNYNLRPPPGPPAPTLTPTVTGGGGIGNPNPSPVNNQNSQNNQIQSQLGSGLDQVERDYQNYITSLSGQEQTLREQAPLAEQSIRASYAPAKTALQDQEATKLGNLATQEQQVTKQKTTGMQSARDLYRQIQQQNVAQMSGLGISSSSVSEALAENLGVETARRIASVSQSADDVYRNIATEKTNIQDYVKNKTADIETTMASQISNIQAQLMQGIRQINEARQIAANDKANRRQDLLQAAQNAVYNLQKGAQDFAQSLQLWQAQTSGKLDAAAKTDYGALMSGMVQNAPAINGFQFTPGVSVDNNGGYKVTGSYVKKPDIYGNTDTTGGFVDLGQ